MCWVYIYIDACGEYGLVDLVIVGPKIYRWYKECQERRDAKNKCKKKS